MLKRSPSQRLAALPRDTRDTLFLLAVIALIVAPHTPHLPWWCSLITVLFLTWRCVLAIRTQPLPSGPWRIAFLSLVAAATYFTFHTLVGRDPGVTLVVALLALKTLELRARRDAFVVFFLGFFAMLTNFFYSQSLLTALAMLLALLGLLTALINAHMPVGRPPLMQTARMAGTMALLGAPIMLALFVFFPRMAPLWGMPSDAMAGRSGLSDSMRVGSIAELALDDGIAARVYFDDGHIPPQSALYFRGPVLTNFNGREWIAREMADIPGPGAVQRAHLRVQGSPVRYEVTLEPTQRNWLLTLDATADAPEAPGLRAAMTPDLQWISIRPLTELLRYRAQSYIRYQSGPEHFSPELQASLTLPPGSNPRTRELAQQMRADPAIASGGPQAFIQAALQRLNTGGYTYTLEPGVYGQDTADEFWFDRKAGFCEHIASSFVILMRAAGIPARIVTGYQGGEFNPTGNYWALRHSDAHAWAEVWQEDAGWLRVDPTGAVSPARVGMFQRLTAPQGLFTGAINAVSPTLMRNLRNLWEAANNSWNQWVLNYTQGRQLNLLKNLGFQTPQTRDLITVLLALVVTASLGAAAWTLWERSQHDPWLRLLGHARKRSEKIGLALPASTPPREMANRLMARFGESARHVSDWLLRLEALRYDAQPHDRLSVLRAEFRRLNWPR